MSKAGAFGSVCRSRSRARAPAAAAAAAAATAAIVTASIRSLLRLGFPGQHAVPRLLLPLLLLLLLRYSRLKRGQQPFNSGGHVLQPPHQPLLPRECLGPHPTVQGAPSQQLPDALQRGAQWPRRGGYFWTGQVHARG